MNNRKGCVSSGPAEWYAARASNTFPSSDPAASWSHYAFHSFFERWSFTLQTSSQAAQRAECSPGSFSTLRVGRLRKSIHFGSALHEPARFDCRFCVFVFLISRRRLTWPPKKTTFRTEAAGVAWEHLPSWASKESTLTLTACRCLQPRRTS